jgi:alcohol dehydrogenase class IV
VRIRVLQQRQVGGQVQPRAHDDRQRVRLQPVAHAAIARFADAIGADDAAEGVRDLARLGGFERLRDLGVPAEDLPGLAAAAAARPGAKANPRPASPEDVEELLRSIW